MVVTSVVSTLMVLYCGLDIDLQGFWDTAGSLNDPAGNKHELDLATIVAEGQNFKSAQVDSWASLGLDLVRISACSLYGDVWWTSEFSVTSVSSLLQSWAIGSKLTYSTSTETPSTQGTVFDTNNYRLIIYPLAVSPVSQAWFAVSAAPLSYSGFPVAFIAKDPSTPFLLPDILDGYLGCFPNSEVTNVTFAKSDSSASYAVCKTDCSVPYNAVIIKGSIGCYCGNLNKNPTGDESNCFLNCPGDNSQRCGGFDLTWQSVYYLPGSEMPGATTSETVFSNTYMNVKTVEIDITELEDTTGNPAFINDIHVILSAAHTAKTYQLFYSAEPCSNNTLHQFTSKDNRTDFQTDGTIVDLGVIMIRCLQINMSELTTSVDLILKGPTNTDHIEVPVIVIQGIKLDEVTTTSTSTTPPPQPPTTTSTTSSTSTTTTTTSSTSSSTSTSTSTTSTSTTTTLTSTSTTPPITTTSTTPAQTTSVTESKTSLTSDTQTTTEKPTTKTATTDIPTTSFRGTESTSVPSTTATTICGCNCNDIIPQTNMTAAELQEKIKALQKHLAVNTTRLSSYIRAKTSAQDNRPLAVSIGALCVALLVTVFGSVILIDSSVLFKHSRMLVRKIKGFFAH